MLENNKTQIHFIYRHKILRIEYAKSIPRKGDEIRLTKNKFYIVDKIV